MKKLIPLITCIFFSLSLGISFAHGKPADTEKIPVVVSIYPLKDMVQQVGGDRVQVDFMVPPGASPHTFEPKPSDMMRVHNARMFVIVGAGLEFWAEKAIRSAGGKDLKVLILSDGLPLIYGADSHDEHRGLQGQKRADPHVWLDPVLAKEMVNAIATALVAVDSSHGRYFRENAERFKKEIDSLDAFIAEKVKTFRTKEYVTFHPAWNYFSRRYGLRVVGVIEESPGKEPSPKHIARLVNEVKRIRARVVFAEPQFSPKVAGVIAKEAGAKVLFLDPNGGPGLQGRDTYIGLMRYNLSVLEGAMR
ncbi:MAG: metal ABC transporter substrate-binding protein [Nitrospirae bacterium]|nr:metal ABC transporter substrate-binding protein [Nitrospirota bacterium]MCL5421770.1 metal ABC transporter substrate-binding protein [Nitrospirota bacterium]